VEDENGKTRHGKPAKATITVSEEQPTEGLEEKIVTHEAFERLREFKGPITVDEQTQLEESDPELYDRLMECGDLQEVCFRDAETREAVVVRAAAEEDADEWAAPTIQDGMYSGGYEGRRAPGDPNFFSELASAGGDEPEKAEGESHEAQTVERKAAALPESIVQKQSWTFDVEVMPDGRVRIPDEVLRRMDVMHGERVRVQVWEVDSDE
jgi:hypothetical protein